MQPILPDETLVALCSRHMHLIKQPLPEALHYFQKNRLLNQLTTLQIDLLRFHKNDAQAMQLFEKLNTLIGQDLEAPILLRQSLELLQTVR